jgi:excisionase family DNA binding protein
MSEKAKKEALDRSNVSVAMDERKYRVPEAAEKLDLAAKTIWSWIGQRRIGVYRVGRSVRIGETEIQRILSEGYTPPRG